MALDSKLEQQFKKIWLIQAMRQHRILISAIFMSFFFRIEFQQMVNNTNQCDEQ